MMAVMSRNKLGVGQKVVVVLRWERTTGGLPAGTTPTLRQPQRTDSP
jgi:hypothetical protein